MPSKISALEVSSVAAIGVRWRASLRSQGKSPRTILSYQAAVDALAAFLNRQGMPEIISSVRREHVEAFIAARQEETTVRGTLRSLTSVGIEFRSLRVFFGYALEEGEIKASPMAKMKPPKPAEMIVPLIDDAAMKKLLKVTERRDLRGPPRPCHPPAPDRHRAAQGRDRRPDGRRREPDRPTVRDRHRQGPQAAERAGSARARRSRFSAISGSGQATRRRAFRSFGLAWPGR
ncbi:MAG: phage integrase N-terminal SAM-like domain-containing protein [Candidatus Limnocylindrales bacterium]